MPRTVFRDATLLDGNRPARTGVTIAIDGDRIAGIDVLPRPEDDVIDLKGKTLMPGMVSGHYHAVYGKPGIPSPGHTRQGSAVEQSYWALGNAQIALRCGYTSVIGAATFHDIDAVMSRMIDAGVVEGPRFIPASRALSPEDNGAEAGDLRDQIVHCGGPAAFRAAARREVERGARIVKLFAAPGHGQFGMRPMTPDEIAAATEAAHEAGARTRAHVAGREAILACVDGGVDIIDHADGMDDDCIDAMADKGCFLVPSLYMPYLALRNGGRAGTGLFEANDYENTRTRLIRAASAGVRIIPGDDYGAPELRHGSYGEELSCYVEEAGIEPLEVIRWATCNGGAATGISDLGTIETGALADLLIVDGDPSADIGILSQPERLTAVIKNGQVAAGQLPAAPAREHA